MTTYEQALETIKTLLPEDRRRLQAWLREQERLDAAPPVTTAPTTKETVEQQITRFRQAMQWIEEHRAEYLGQWVALEGDQLISHGPDALQVHREAKAAGIASPFLEQVLEKEKPFCGGWT